MIRKSSLADTSSQLIPRQLAHQKCEVNSAQTFLNSASPAYVHNGFCLVIISLVLLLPLGLVMIQALAQRVPGCCSLQRADSSLVRTRLRCKSRMLGRCPLRDLGGLCHTPLIQELQGQCRPNPIPRNRASHRMGSRSARQSLSRLW